MGDINSIDWNAVKEDVEVRGARRTGMVALIAKAAKAICADGKDYDVAHIRAWIQHGLNQGVPEEDQVVVNWITVQYTLRRLPGFTEVSKNTFRYDPSAKKKKK